MSVPSGVNDGRGSSPNGSTPLGADDAPDESKAAGHSPPAPLGSCLHSVVSMDSRCIDCGEVVHVDIRVLNGPPSLTLTAGIGRMSEDAVLVEDLTAFLHDEVDMGGASAWATKRVLDFIQDWRRT